MRTMVILALGALAFGSVSHAADTRHYDCSKPGNANKAVCKGALATGPAGAASQAAAPAAASAKTPAGPAATKAARTYDCSKAGNKIKAACKGEAAAAPAPVASASNPSPPPAAAASPKHLAPQAAASAAAVPSAAASSGAPRIVAWTEKNGKVVHYNCSKAGNFTKKACKTS